MCRRNFERPHCPRHLRCARSLKMGASGSVVNLFADRRLNTHTAVQGGILSEQCLQNCRIFLCATPPASRTLRIEINLNQQISFTSWMRQIKLSINISFQSPPMALASKRAATKHHGACAKIGENAPRGAVFVAMQNDVLARERYGTPIHHDLDFDQNFMAMWHRKR